MNHYHVPHAKTRICVVLLLMLVPLLVLLPTVRVAYAQPIVETDPATNITGTSAQLNGVVRPNEAPYYSYWQFILTSGPGGLVPPSCSGNVAAPYAPTPVSCQVTQLAPSTSYEFLLYACDYSCLMTNEPNPRQAGSELSFTTSSIATAPLSVQTLPATDVTGTSATLNGIVTPNGEDTNWKFIIGEAGQEPGLPLCSGMVPGSAGPTPVSCQLTQASTPDPASASFELEAWQGSQPPQGGGVLTISSTSMPTMATIMTIASITKSSGTSTTPQPKGPGFDFALSVSPSTVSVQQGGTAHYAASVMYSDPSYAGTMINVQLTGLGPEMNYDLSQSGDLTITTSQTTPTGSYSILLTGSANGVTHQTEMTLIVTSAQAATTAVTSASLSSTPTGVAPFDYSVTVSPSTQSVEVGGSASYVVSVIPLIGSSVPVSLTIMGLPGDVRSSFTTQSATPPYTSTLDLDFSTSSANAGAYTLTVLATATGNVKSATATLIIQPKAGKTTTSQTSTGGSGWSDVLQQNSLTIIIALLALAAVLGVLAMRSRRQHGAPQPTGSSGIFCSKCGTGNPASNEFCRGCGNKLKGS